MTSNEVDAIRSSCDCLFELGNGNIWTYVNGHIPRIRNGTNTT